MGRYLLVVDSWSGLSFFFKEEDKRHLKVGSTLVSAAALRLDSVYLPSLTRWECGADVYIT